MKLLCVNVKDIMINGVNHWGGQTLEEGVVYTTRGKKFTASTGQECYYIDGLGERLACRFTELLDDEPSEEEKASEEAIEKIKQDLHLN